MFDYVALRDINAPGSYARAYNTGDPVTAQVVADWNLSIGQDVAPADNYQAPWPGDNSDDRAAWEAYVIGHGADPVAVRNASLDDLRAMYDPPPPPEPPHHDLPASVAPEGVDGTGIHGGARPADSAKKEMWVEYVLAQGAPPQWVGADTTTKADLIAWTA